MAAAWECSEKPSGAVVWALRASNGWLLAEVRHSGGGWAWMTVLNGHPVYQQAGYVHDAVPDALMYAKKEAYTSICTVLAELLDDLPDRTGVEMTDESIRMGACSVPVLPFLNGQEWGPVAQGFVCSLRPSSVRVIRPREEEKTDGQLWRVTVHLGDVLENNVWPIAFIEQEVLVGLDGTGCRNGGELAFKAGLR